MIKNRNTNYSATSELENGTVLMKMSAYVDNGSSISFSQSIPDMKLYEANKAVADKDYEDFKSDVISENDTE